MLSKDSSKFDTFDEKVTSLHKDDGFAASMQDCTGLEPTPAHNEFEAESYDAIAHYLPPFVPTDPSYLFGGDDTPLAEGIHNETRYHVSRQNLDEK